jgi:sporulation protein YlmC with PRC-barrel domain
MKKISLKFSVLCAACSMISASALAQYDAQNNPSMDQNRPASSLSSDQSNRSWSTKHLSATGRDTDTAVRASKLNGSQVNDSSGQNVGQIQDIILNPVSGRIDFALLALKSENGNGGKLIPVPWALLRTSASAQYGGSSEQPNFTLNADRNKLVGAPSVDWSDLSQSQWRQRIYSYYGVTPQSSVGGAESPSGEIKGEGARQMQNPTPPQPPSQPNR